MKGWTDIGSDVDWAGYHGLWTRQAPDGTWFVIRFTNMFDACGEGACRRDGWAEYYAETCSVNLSELSDEQIRRALDSVGYDEIEHGPPSDLVKVEALVGYGACAPLESFSGESYPERVRAKARRAAEAMIADAAAHEAALERPVNKIGTTAREYMHGDLNAALFRYQSGAEPADPAKDLVLKLHGFPARQS
jgi:hypothetical protein